MITSVSYDIILIEYRLALKWMKTIGVKIDKGRTLHYERVIRFWTEAYQTASFDECKKDFPQFVSSILEIHDFLYIYKVFRCKNALELEGLVITLNKAVNGPIYLGDESPDSTKARNFLFEALVAARLNAPTHGSTVNFNAESDVEIVFNENKISIECKRITSKKQINKNIKIASKQLEKSLKKSRDSDHKGIIALDVSKLINSVDQVYVSIDDDHLLGLIEKLINKIIHHFAPIWQDIYKRRDRRIIGTLIRFSFMSITEKRGLLVHTTQWGLNPRDSTSIKNHEIQKKLVSCLNRNSNL